MAADPVRASADWLALREPADAAARAAGLVALLQPCLPADGLVIHDLGSGTGSMARWLAPRLPGPQHWVLHDRDAELLARVAVPLVSVETRPDDVTRLAPGELAAADLITASALLDMLTAEELERLVDLCAAPGCPVLITLTVAGRVELSPPDPLDRRVMAAFNAHQRRDSGAGRLLGPDAAGAAVAAFAGRGRDVVVRPSRWQLGPEHRVLAAEWFSGWLAAAVEQEPGLSAVAAPYARRRRAEALAGSLSVVVRHDDLLVRPPGPPVRGRASPARGRRAVAGC